MQALSRETSVKFANISFLCSLIVVFVHCWAPSPVGSPAWWIYSFVGLRKIVIPFFFLMSGYLLAGRIGEEGWWRRENLKRARSLLIPYFLWNALWLLFLVCRQMANDVGRGGGLSLGLGPVLADCSFLGLNPFLPPPLEPLWYVRSLLICVFLSPLLMWALKKNRWLVLGLAFAKLFYYKGEEAGTWFYLVDRTFAFGFLFFFLLGMALRKGLVAVPRPRHVAASGMVALGITAFVPATYAFLGYDLSRMPRLLLFACLRLDSVGMFFWMYFIWFVMPVRQLPALLTNVTFPLYLLHWFVLAGIWQYYAYEIPGSVGELLMSFAVGTIGTLLVVLLLQRFAPRVSSVLFGQRC